MVEQSTLCLPSVLWEYSRSEVLKIIKGRGSQEKLATEGLQYLQPSTMGEDRNISNYISSATKKIS
jgi:hypothetical protein